MPIIESRISRLSDNIFPPLFTLNHNIMQTEIFLILSLQIFQKCYLYVAICKTGKFNQIQFAEEKISSVENSISTSAV